MNTTLKKISIAILGVLSALFLFLGIWGNSFTAKADGAALIPEGYTVAPYSVKDIKTPISNVTTGWSGTGEQNFTLDGASAVRFTLTHNGGNWGWVNLALFANTSYSTDSGTGMILFKLYKEKSSDNSASYSIYQTNNDNAVATSTFEQPESLSFTSGSTYQIEVGGIDVLNGSGNVVGKIFYLEIDGTRIVEKYLETTISFTCDKFAYNIWSQNVTFSAMTTAAVDISETANVTFAEDGYDCKDGPVTPAPIVTVNKTVNGITYPQIVDAANYDVAYTNNDVKGTGTATVTFKGIYSGTASGNFTVTKTERIIPTGYTVAPYQVLDVTAQTMGDGSATNVDGTSQALGSAKAARFKLTANNKINWALTVSLFSTTKTYLGNSNEGSFYFTIHPIFKNYAITILSGSTAVAGGNNVEVAKMADEMYDKLCTDGSVYTIEIGGVTVLNASGAKAGTLMYLDIDGTRVAEHYYANSELGFEGDNFNVNSTNSSGAVSNEITPISTLGDVSSTASVTFAQSEYDCSFVTAEPNPVVKITRTVGEGDLAVDYTEIVSDKYYDVTYADNTAAGTATANIAFKGIYSGTASGNFTVTLTGLNKLNGHQNPMPDGYVLSTDYTIKNIETPISNVTTDWLGTGEQVSALDGADVVRFTLTHTGGNWGLINLAMFANTYYRTDANTAMIYFKLGKDSSYGDGKISYEIYQTNNQNKVMSGFVAQPEWLNFSAGSVYGVEMGGIDILLATNGEYAGKLFYLEIGGVRILEIPFISSIPVSCDNFAWHMYSQNVTLSSYDISEENVIDLTGKTRVETKAVYHEQDIYAQHYVFGANMKNDEPYVRLIESKYYDVSYSNLTETSGTVTFTYKGKYKGTSSADFEIIGRYKDASNAIITLSQTLYTVNADGTAITPAVVAVDLDGKAIKSDCYDVSYEDNKTEGTAKVVVDFKNGYYGKAVALFRINPILSDKHSIDYDNANILDLATVYGGESKKFEVTNEDVKVDDMQNATYDMKGYDVVRFKMTTTNNIWAQYFGMFNSDKYYKGDKGNFNFSFGSGIVAWNSGVSTLDLRSGSTTFETFKSGMPEGFDLYGGGSSDFAKTFNVEIGALKIYYNDDGDITYAGRYIYLAIDGEIVNNYVLLNDSLEFGGDVSNFVFGGNAAKLTIEEFDTTKAVAKETIDATVYPQSARLTGLNVENLEKTNFADNSETIIAENIATGNNVVILSTMIAAATVAFVVIMLALKRKNNKNDL